MIKIFLLTSLIFISSVSFAGNGSSGGGGAFVCREGNGNIKSSHLLDLWESQQILNLNIPLTNDNVDDQINLALSKLSLADPLLAKVTLEYISIIFSNANRLGDDIALPPPADADPRYQKRGCPLEGMMYFNGNLNQLEISPSVYDKLATQTDLAAAKIHEALYFVIRNNVIKNTNIYGMHVSTPIRRLVGCLFSTNFECLFPTITKDQILEKSDSAYLCSNSNISYYLVKNNAEIELSRRQYRCDFVTSGGFDTSWIGLLNQVKDQTFLIPTYFIKDKNLSSIQACSKLIEFNFSTALKVEAQVNKDPRDGHPIYTGFKEYSNDREKYGTPVCRKIK